MPWFRRRKNESDIPVAHAAAPVREAQPEPVVTTPAVAGSAAPILLYGSSYISEPAGPGSREWTPFQTGLILGGLAAMLAAVWGALGLLVKRSACRSVSVVLAIVCAGASVTVMLSGYASGGQIGLMISAALLGAVIASLVLAGTPEMNSVVSLGVVGLFALLLVGRFFGQLSTANAALLFCAPILEFSMTSWCVSFLGESPAARFVMQLIPATRTPR